MQFIDTNTIRHLSFIFGAEILSFIVALILTPFFVKFIEKYGIKKQIRDDAMSGEKATLFHQLHAKKSGTPTMGGIIIWGSILIVVAFSRIASALGITDKSLLNRKETWVPIFTLITMAILGLVDDYINVKGTGSKGIRAKTKMLWLLIFATAGALWFFFKLDYNQIHIPFMGSIGVGWLYIPIFIFVIVGTANAVNVTDGLDGLAGGLLIIAFTAFGAIAYTKSLLILAAFCGVIAGALFAFVWFNVPPAKFYMGDTGSLALGGTLGVIAMLTDSVLILPIIGLVFVIEMLSVIIQLTSKKLFHRKVFRIAPIHHHFEHMGWSEASIVMRFWIIGGFIAAVGLIVGFVGRI
ncbi:MAG: phospho-N-acetylmuramoyl-pentapeptide-transferase, phospho-N-acetylmuramoyl-pentapeptide-transferase [Candidatus Peregrinibacteria bacterium GW2011_GWF2_38_29]|nr:MAG: phospho-N-acetylmuramoyl-pentapeptide-transferase, phospho-N-acetylmuramoyl-pentapeptide-transferase [Candidatus Peregrinibacteria bacterium GW2011_GWF2_38_29]HBB02775.1 phospho-N-acetylmuramoyl-pentapeptide-transferase [Candidatus Peregrinibacteria bacterium]